MTLRQTHTYAALEVSAMVYEEIAKKLRDAGYDHAFDKDEGAIDMQGIGLVKAAPADDGMTRIAVLRKFDSADPIGEMRIRTDALPPLPNFCFALGYEALGPAGAPGSVPTSRYEGPYKLLAVSIVEDEGYLGYLRQVGVAPPVQGLHKQDAEEKAP